MPVKKKTALVTYIPGIKMSKLLSILFSGQVLRLGLYITNSLIQSYCFKFDLLLLVINLIIQHY